MTAVLSDPVTETIGVAREVLSRRTGAPVSLLDPVDLGGDGRAVVLRVRVVDNSAILPRTLVLKCVDPRNHDGSPNVGFLRETASYQLITALSARSRPGPALIAYDLSAGLIVLTDLGDHGAVSALLRAGHTAGATNTLMAMAQALGRMHAATVGREEDFRALAARVGIPAGRPEEHFRALSMGTIDTLPERLGRRLSVKPSDAALDRITTAIASMSDGRFRAFSSSDMCPDNLVVDAGGVRFLDYEWGGYRNVFLDLTYPLMSFPGCLCKVDIEPATADAMIDAWRAEVASIWPQLADDRYLEARVLEGRLSWAWLTTARFLEASSTARTAAAHRHHLAARRADVLRLRWELLRSAADRAGDAAIVELAADMVDALDRVGLP